jgi:hypothetical protein
MQQSGQVAWDPASIDKWTPWESKLLILYLVIVLGISVVKIAKLVRYFWFSSSSPSETEPLDARIARNRARGRITSLRRLSVLTLLVSLFGGALGAIRDCSWAAMEKVTGPAVIFGTLAEELTLLALGLGVCVFLYATAMLWEGLLRRRTSSEP